MDDAVFAAEQWTDAVFWPWLAGYFDRGGRVRLPPEKTAVYLSLWGKNASILHAIRDRVNAGDVQERLTIPPSAVWRVQRQAEVERVLLAMLPYLTTWREAAYEALDRFSHRRATADRIHDARDRRNREILIRWELGHESLAQIAAVLNTTPSVVTQVIARNRAQSGITLRRSRSRKS